MNRRQIVIALNRLIASLEDQQLNNAIDLESEIEKAIAIRDEISEVTK